MWHTYSVYFLFFVSHAGILEWPFWTKLVVVAIGFTGGLVFMYVQCKVYIQLWKRLKAYNRVIYVQNRPETCKKNVFDKPSLLEHNLENKEALGPAQRTQTLPSTQRQRTTVWRSCRSDRLAHIYPSSPLEDRLGRRMLRDTRGCHTALSETRFVV